MMNENLVFRIGLVDLPTLSLAAGIGNLVLLILTWVYAKTAREVSLSLKPWQLSRCGYVVGLCLYFLRPVAPLWLTHVVAAFVITLALAIEFRDFQLLLGFRLPWKIIVAGILLILCGRIWIYLSSMKAMVAIAYNSVCFSSLSALLGVLLARRSGHGGLVRLMGGNMMLFALLMFIRIFPMGWPDIPGMPSFETLHLTMWIWFFLAIFINGFGYFLLVKQQDDEKLRQALEEVILAEAEQRQLLSLASHEFRTPAAMIATTLDSLTYLEQEITPAVAARHANIRHGCQRLIHLANSLITQDRLRGLHFELVAEEIDLIPLINEIVHHYVEPLVWQPTLSFAPARVDAALIRIALHNLIDNALRHSTPDQPPGILLTHDADGYELSVSDLGSGVPDSDKEKVFERFFRKDAGPGSGLGLSIVRQIARLHGGDTIIRDHAPHGACFVIKLPDVDGSS